MQCPTDGSTLVMSERSGVEIDYCPTCRGVWLDRGELDKILDRAAAEGTGFGAAPSGPSAAPFGAGGYAPTPGYDRTPAPGGRGYDDRDDRRDGNTRDGYNRDGYDRNGYGRDGRGQGGRRKKESWLSDLFD